jgi:hypothetical protein
VRDVPRTLPLEAVPLTYAELRQYFDCWFVLQADGNVRKVDSREPGALQRRLLTAR